MKKSAQQFAIAAVRKEIYRLDNSIDSLMEELAGRRNRAYGTHLKVIAPLMEEAIRSVVAAEDAVFRARRTVAANEKQKPDSEGYTPLVSFEGIYTHDGKSRETLKTYSRKKR